jgi:hypothetical protein
MEALAVGMKALPSFSHRNSPKVYTQPQLFACLALKTFLKADYRGIAQMLQDLPDLVAVLGLRAVPHYTTLQKACRRLLISRHAGRLLDETVRRFMGRRRRVPLAAFDSSGFDCGHASRYYVNRRAKGQAKDEKPSQNTKYKRFAKLEVVVDCQTHLILAAIPGRGPRPDSDRLVPLLDAALDRVRIVTALGDAGYDSEPNHVYAREKRGVRSVIPATTGRPTEKPPTGKYRRLMRRNLTEWTGFLYCKFGHRWQVETVISMIKRRLSDAVAGVTYWSQCRDLSLMAITHNLMLLGNP